MGDHAKLSPSSAARWSACPGSVAACEGRPNPDSEASLHGTFCHEVAALVLNNPGKNAKDYIGYQSEDLSLLHLTFTAEDAEHVQTYVDYVRGRQFTLEADLKVEVKVFLRADLYGTSDAVLYALAAGVIEVVDLKMGSGHFVKVEGNRQLTIYAIGAYNRLSFAEQEQVKSFVLTIVQPRRPDSEGRAVRSAEMTRVGMIAERVNILAAADETAKPDAPRVAGEHCTWCLAAADCPALRDRALAVAQSVFTHADDCAIGLGAPASGCDCGGERLEVAPPPVESMTPAQLGDVLDKLPILEEWIAKVHKSAEARARTEKIPGRKLVETVGHRKWKDEGEAAAALRAAGVEPFEQSIISPAAADKLLGKRKKLTENLTVRPVTGVVLVEESDKRPAYNVGLKFLGDLLD